MKEKITTISIAVIALSLIIQAVLMFTDDNNETVAPAATALSTDNSAAKTAINSVDGLIADGEPMIVGDNTIRPVDPALVTQINFEQPVKDLGTLKAGEIVNHTFKFVNVGNLPLTMTGVNVDVGITLISAPTDPIPTGGSGEIIVEFNTEGLSGPITKTIHVNANTDPSHQHINFTANIIE